MPKGEYSFKELGLSGLKRDSWYVHEEFLVELRGTRGVQVYREMRNNDPTVGAILFAIDMLVRQVTWTVEAGDAKDADVEFLESCMDDMSHSWSDFVSEVLSMLVFGWSYHEIVYKLRNGNANDDARQRSKYDDGMIGWRKLPLRSQDSLNRWEFDNSGGTKGMWQIAPPTYDEVFLPIEKSLHFRTSNEKGNPEGRSVLRNAYRPWFFKKRIEEIEAIGIERDLAGLPVAYVDPSMLLDTASEKEREIIEGIKTMVVNIRRDKQEGVVFPRSYDANGNPLFDLTLLSTGGTRQFNTDAIINRYDQRIAQCVLADFILLGHEKVGSFALSSDKTDLFAMALAAWTNSIADVLNRHAVPRLFALNDLDLEKLPTIVPGDIESPNLVEVADYVSKLTSAGVPLFPDPNLEKHLREIANFPEPDEEILQMREELDQQKLDADKAFQEQRAQNPMGIPQPGMPPQPGAQEEQPATNGNGEMPQEQKPFPTHLFRR